MAQNIPPNTLVTSDSASYKAQLGVGDLLRQSWSIFKANWTILLLLIIVLFLVQFIPNMLTAAFEDSGLEVLSPLISLVSLVLNLLTSIGWTVAILKMARGEKVMVGELFKHSGKLWNYALGTILVGLLVFVGFLLFIIPGIVWSIKYMFVPYLIADSGMGARAALKASSQMTEGIKWNIFGLVLALLVVNIVGMLALLVGLLVTIPVTTIASAMLYERLRVRTQDNI